MNSCENENYREPNIVKAELMAYAGKVSMENALWYRDAAARVNDYIISSGGNNNWTNELVEIAKSDYEERDVFSEHYMTERTLFGCILNSRSQHVNPNMYTPRNLRPLNYAQALYDSAKHQKRLATQEAADAEDKYELNLLIDGQYFNLSSALNLYRAIRLSKEIDKI